MLSRFEVNKILVINKNERVSNRSLSVYIGELLRKNKVGQVTIFIIIAILIVVGVAAYFVLRAGIFEPSLPQELEGVYSYYLSCVEQEVSNGALILGEQGGYIETPEFSPGTEYMPFSSQLDFFGFGVPYWYYISGNGIEKEQIPSKAKMQEQLNDFLEQGVLDCDFFQFEEQGFEVNFGEADVKTSIKDKLISVSVKQEFNINYGEISWRGTSHSASVSSSLGKFYDLSKKIYLNNKQEMFLENYGVDILRLYAPVDGSEIGCSPKLWFVDDIRKDLIVALENNVPAVKLKGDYYEGGDDYFIKDIGENVDFDVNFLYLREWPMKMEVWPSEDDLLKAEPIGLQEGMGMLGFCYTPYHFVYDFAYPVMVQLYSGSEMFQFPVVVYINKNNPREALDVEGIPDVVPELCEHKNTELSVYTYDTNLENVEAEIKFKCFDTTCNIGGTEIDESGDAVLIADFPQCVNGFILASADGYKTKKHQISSVESGSATIILDKKYKLDLEIQKQGSKLSDDYAVVTFTKDGEVETVAYPEMKEIALTEGEYEIKVYIYSNSSINLAGSSTQKCIDVPKSGILGVFGMTEEKCFTLDIPDQIISFAVSGGGTQGYYITESELQGAEKLIINAESFGKPTKIEDLQVNYNSVEVNGLDVVFG